MDTFKEAIENATMKWTEYKQKERTYKGKVNVALVELERLIGKLKLCIDKLKELEGDYAGYISRITRIREGMQIMLNAQIGQIQRNTDKNCDKKIKELLEKFQGFVSQIKGWEGDANAFAGLLKALDDEIKELCDEADRIVAQNDDNKSKLDEELRKVEERLNPGGSASKQNADDDERKEGPPREEQEARLREAEAELARRRQQADQSQQPQQPQQRQRRTAQQERDARIAARRENMHARQQQRNTGPSDRFGQGSIYGRRVQGNENYDGSMNRGQGAERGGWQTPQKLESISRYSPIRRVTRKKKKKKKRNTKKNKKRRRRKQTKRRGKKRN